MADELSFLTINAASDSWVDDIPSAVSTGYQAQNTNIEARNLGQDDTSMSISGTNITLDSAGVIDDDGLPIVINSAVTLPVGSDGDWYIKVIAGSTATQRSLTLQAGGGTWDTSKQGYYDTGDRVLNWKITRASGALKLYKRTKPNEGLELNGDITATQADVTTINTTDINATTGSITTVDSTTVGATTGNITTVNATTVNTDSVDTGDGGVTFDQETRTDSDVILKSLSLAEEFNPTKNPIEDTDTITSPGTIAVANGVFSLELTVTQSNPGGTGDISTTVDLEVFRFGSWRIIDTITISGADGFPYTATSLTPEIIASSSTDTRVVVSEQILSGSPTRDIVAGVKLRKY